MSPLPAKRRKLDHSSTPLDNSETYEQQPASIASREDAVPPKPTHNKQVHEGDDAALYSGGLYKSSLFKLQVDELLREVAPNYEKRFGGLTKTLHKLKGLIEDIEEHDALSIAEATKWLHKSHRIAIPFPDPKPDKNAAYKLIYAKPSHINVIGSYALKTMVKSDSTLSVDMLVVMPAALFQEKDYLNYRYFYKRAYYLACVAAGLQQSAQKDFSVAFEYLHGNDLHPILVLKPKSDESKPVLNYAIKIIPAAPQILFGETKLRPTKNCVRQKDGVEGESAVLLPTPFYNASLRADCNFEAYLKLLHSATKTSDGFKDACILGRIWLRQRGFASGLSNGGFGHFEWATLTALLLKFGGPKGHSILSPGYSSYQMFKGVLQFLSSNDLVALPVAYGPVDFVISKSSSPVLYDGQRGQNLLYKMMPWSYHLLREEARASLSMLNDGVFDPFESTFIIRTSQPLQRWDCMFQLSLPSQNLESPSCDHRSSVAEFGFRIAEVLAEGLTDRIKLFDIRGPSTSSWSTMSTRPTNTHPSLVVSVAFNSATIDRLVDHGPPAEEKYKALKFRKFWGEKAELRRFKDGTILESLVWSPGSTYSIFQNITTYLLKQHFGTEIASSLKFTGEGFEKLLPGPGTSTKSFETLRQSFSAFEKQVRDLEGLPLQLRHLSPVSPQLRYSSIEQPSFRSGQPLRIPASISIQFEGSGRWPDDVVAIQRTKIAFLLKIGSLLEEVNKSIVTRLGLENGDKPLQNCAFLDVIYGSGAVFRLRIHNDREQTLLERQIKDKSSDHRAREDAVLALSVYKSSFLHLPLHTQSIATHCTRFPLLSPTIRLVKMWFDRHMLAGHIREEVIELLVARTFLQPYPWRSPSSTMTGFLRTLLFISRWDWRTEPLIVDFTGTMTSIEVDSINTRLEAWRKIDPVMNRTVLFAASNHDTSGTAFTGNGPSKLVATRMTALARSACKLVKDKELDLDPRSLFATSTTDYDFVIHLSPQLTGDHRRKEASKPNYKNLEVQSEASMEKVGYQPVLSYIEELKNLYTNSMVLFYSEIPGLFIAGLWNPQAVATRSFKVNLTYPTRPAHGVGEGAEDVELDKSAILAEVARLGGDMVSEIVVNR
ncbi:pre-rRNA processing protein-like protein Utp22 [Stipitochalara longipes BDJ]|nr:pre-rRNA processing protein-like protein Utp22 [Stipitochalara longipes BDJ]